MRLKTLALCLAATMLLVPVVAEAERRPPPAMSAAAKAKHTTTRGTQTPAPKRKRAASAVRQKPSDDARRRNADLATKKKQAHPERRRAGNWSNLVSRLFRHSPRQPVYNKSMQLSEASLPSDANGRRPLPPRGRLSVYYASTTAQAGDIAKIDRPRRGANR